MLPLFDNIPTRRLAVVSYALIGVNVLVWVWELSVSAGRIDHYAFYPCAVQGPCVGPARDHLPWAEGTVSSMFLHASWLHLLGNMLFLWIFANNVEDVMGRFRFLVFYFAAGFAAALTQTVVTLHFSGTAAASIPTIGASGAIAGVLGAYFVLLPHARVVTLLFGFLPGAALGDDLPRRVVCLPALAGRLLTDASRRGRRGRVRRARGRVRARHAGRPALPGAGAAAPPLVSFEEIVEAALAELPPELARGLENVAIVIEEERADDPELFGLWEAEDYMPDKITIFRRPLQRSFPDEDELREEIRITVLHELAHYFGIDEDRLDELGYG